MPPSGPESKPTLTHADLIREYEELIVAGDERIKALRKALFGLLERSRIKKVPAQMANQVINIHNVQGSVYIGRYTNEEDVKISGIKIPEDEASEDSAERKTAAPDVAKFIGKSIEPFLDSLKGLKYDELDKKRISIIKSICEKLKLPNLEDLHTFGTSGSLSTELNGRSDFLSPVVVSHKLSIIEMKALVANLMALERGLEENVFEQISRNRIKVVVNSKWNFYRSQKLNNVEFIEMWEEMANGDEKFIAKVAS